MPEGTSQKKIDYITFFGGSCHLTDPGEIYSESQRLADERGGHYMDQSTYAERATDWRGNNNIADSIFSQMCREPYPIPAWIVMSAGTGGTSATIGRYLRYERHSTRLCVADPDNSVFYDAYSKNDITLTIETGSNIEGIGRPRVERSFLPSVIDRMIQVPDAAAFAAIHFLEHRLNRKCGGSTGTNLVAAIQLIAAMKANRQLGSVVTLICDAGNRYLDTYYNSKWLLKNKYDIAPWLEQLNGFYHTGNLPDLHET